MAINIIGPDEAYRSCPPDTFNFTTTEDIKDDVPIAGQERALEAVEFGIGIEKKGFNLFVLGPQGTGRHTVIRSFIDQKALTGLPPTEWCYVNNFKLPHQPLAFTFPQGQALIFKKEMHDLVELLKVTLSTVFEGDEYNSRERVMTDEFKERVDALYLDIETRAKRESIAVVKSEKGVMVAPMDGEGNILDTEAYLNLPETIRKKIDALIQKYQTELQDCIHQISLYKKEAEAAKRKLKNDLARQVVSGFINTLKQKYEAEEELCSYLQDVEDDVVEHVDDFLYNREDGKENVLAMMSFQEPSFERYEVNILVSNSSENAPVVYEDLPNYQNLHGRIENYARMGMLSTHFTLIKPGSLHRANGGYIIIDARRLLTQPYAYEGLKRTLRSQEIKIEPLERLLGMMNTVSLEPAPIPLRAKVVLIGDPWLYYLLREHDPEFNSLFKVQVDFEHSMERTPDNVALFGALVAGMVKRDNLMPVDNSGVARLVEHSARLSGDSNKISLYLEQLDDIVKEAEYIARRDGLDCIRADHISAALKAAEKRSSRIRDRMFEMTVEGTRHIETDGEHIGQVNGLSVLHLPSSTFGLPCRITALTRPSKDGEVIDIEKKVDLGGPIHSKGVLILESFLRARYLKRMPIGLRASLVFEQSYGGVDGDSASCAELSALLSSLAGVPVKQGVAITGAVSQKGEVQAIGGVNEKIEGFFDLCAERGLDGSHGVIIPAANVRHLMVKEEVLKAMREREFTLWSVSHVDEAIEILTGIQAGERNSAGKFPDESVNGMVEKTLTQFVLDMKEFSREKKERKSKS